MGSVVTEKNRVLGSIVRTVTGGIDHNFSEAE
jgi:hypothetical protein